MKTKKGLSANHIGQAAKFDPQLRVPKFPRIRRDIDVEQNENELVVTGTPKRQIFRGSVAATILPKLMHLLDGKHDHQALSQQLEVSEEIVFRILALLWTSGVIEENSPRIGSNEIDQNEALVNFVSRIGDSTAANSCWEDAVTRWSNTHFAIWGNRELSARLKNLLQRDSLVEVEQINEIDPGRLSRVDLILVLEDGENRQTAKELISLAWELEKPVLCFRITSSVAQLGPYLLRGLTPCFDCSTTYDPSPSTQKIQPFSLEIGITLFCREIFALVSRSCPSPLPNKWRSVDLQSLTVDEVFASSQPGCTNCTCAAPSDENKGIPAPLPVLYEAGVSMPPKQFADPKAHQVHYKSSNLQLQHLFRTWPIFPKTKLPPAVFDEEFVKTQASSDSALDSLSLLLNSMAGLKEISNDKVKRWTASGGNIGSVMIYVVIRDFIGVPPGIYAWVPKDNSLANLGIDITAFESTAPVSFILTGDFLKVASKYGAFALRILFLDSGCALATAQRLTAKFGWSFKRNKHLEDLKIHHFLSLDPELEPVTAMFDVTF
ncbi:MAG: hypothetical protein Q4D85_14225 [Corynebacterium sp.]|uniref:hypothetical protein n=1 Tax=Corynebacterium sp. TaxID=1720 RepID=UPI0026DB018A|nr:hypothetical protein [Corynebacterium sp.]MDO5099891.1 hypothetical protein [Corynebacterium sp.]